MNVQQLFDFMFDKLYCPLCGGDFIVIEESSYQFRYECEYCRQTGGHTNK